MRKQIIDKRLTRLYEVLSENVVRLRGKMSQGDLAKIAGVSRETVSAVENKRAISLDSLFKIAVAFNVHPSDLLKSRDEERGFFNRLDELIDMKIAEALKTHKH